MGRKSRSKGKRRGRSNRALSTKMMEDILLECIELYSNEGNRSIDGEIPMYYKDGSKGCPVGRLLGQRLSKTIDTYSPVTNVRILIQYVSEGKIPEVAIGDIPSIVLNNVDFFHDIQLFHDLNRNWDKNSLSLYGQIALNKIIQDFKLDERRFDKYFKSLNF